jgi:hypothetical protein
MNGVAARQPCDSGRAGARRCSSKDWLAARTYSSTSLPSSSIWKMFMRSKTIRRPCGGIGPSADRVNLRTKVPLIPV